MVLEHIFPEDWLERKASFAFILGIIYSVIGVLIASVIFPGDPALVAVAFTSLLILPELYKIFDIEERKEAVEQHATVGALYRDDIDLIKIYIFLFLGILLVYSLGTMLLPELSTNNLFREQLEIRYGQGFSGQAIISAGLFWDLLKNNFMVMIACFLLALLTGDGAIFLITWNASVWGTIFGLTAKKAAIASGSTNPFVYFGIIMAVVFPHMMIEAICYFLAAISGSMISKDVILEKFESHRFWEVFIFNAYLFLFALLFLLLGALVEAWVLDNVTIYQEIIRLSFAG
ncbi:hypothetical protein CL619_00495 [archaeon]|nr:hypothetical protein [archaeon]|tara:strand:- start:2792 stop:3658 length:867 start_codon:yes stop_codon:yes gene_type:complete